MLDDIIYVLAHNGGCEGFSGPVQAFTNLDVARAALALADESMAIFEVPVFPCKAQGRWYDVRPMEFK